MNTRKGQLYIVSAPSGAGKSSLLNALRGQVQDVVVSVSHTTRLPRPGEQDGVHYHFTDVATFRQQVDGGNFLEHAQVFDNFYGTSKLTVEALLDAGKDVILEIDWQGAQLVRERADSTVSIFILPPSTEDLLQRLRSRGQDCEATIQRRMRDARSEMSHYAEYDYVIVNDGFDFALEELCSIFRAERLRQGRQALEREMLLNALVAG